MTEFEVAGASLATEPPEPALEDRGFDYARVFQNRVIEWIHDGTDPVSVVRAPTGAGKTATFYELIDDNEMTLLVYPTNALLRQQRERFEDDDVDVAVLNANTLDGHGHERTEQLISFVNTYAADYDAILTNPDILQAVIQDMYIGSDPMRFFDWFDAIVYDEFHFYGVLSASGLLLQIKIIAERQANAKILLASATPNEEFVDFLRDRIGLTIRDINSDYDSSGDQFRHRMIVNRHEDRKLIDCRDEIAAELQEKLDAIDDYSEPQVVLVFNSARDSNNFHDFLYREYPAVFEHAVKDNGFDTNDETVDLDDEKFFILNTTSKGEVGLDYDITTLYMEKPFTASAFLQRFGRAGRQSKATVDIYGLGKGPWGDNVDFPTFVEQIYEGLESTQMEQEWLADLVGFRAAYAITAREDDSVWFNQELREDFETNIDKSDQWYGFVRAVESEHDGIKDEFEPGKYQQDDPEAKLLEFTKECFKTFRGLRGQSLPVSIKYPRGDKLGVTTYNLTTTLRNYDIVDVEDDDILVLEPSDDDILSTVTARLPAYETEPTQYDRSTKEIEDLLQTKIHRHIDQVELTEEFEVSTELLHRFFRIIRIVDAIIPSRLTTSEYDIEIDRAVNGPPKIDVQPRQI